MNRLLTTTLLKLTLLHCVHGMRIEPSLTDTFKHHEEYSTPSSSSSLLHSLDVRRTLVDSGFHKILHTEIIYNGDSCSSINRAGIDTDEEFVSVIVVVNITSDLYVDMDQVRLGDGGTDLFCPNYTITGFLTQNSWTPLILTQYFLITNASRECTGGYKEKEDYTNRPQMYFTRCI